MNLICGILGAALFLGGLALLLSGVGYSLTTEGTQPFDLYKVIGGAALLLLFIGLGTVRIFAGSPRSGSGY